MVRVTNPTLTHTLVYDTVNPLVTDYVSQTDTAAQAMAGNLAFANGKYLSAKKLLPSVSVFVEGSNYRVLDRDGALQYNSTSFEVAMNDEAYNSLGGTKYEKVDVSGTITLDDTLLPPTYSFTDFSQAKITSAAALNKPMMQCAINDDHITVLGGVFDGNSTNQSGGTIGGFDFNKTGVSDFNIHGVKMSNVYGTGLSIQAASHNITNCDFLIKDDTGQPWETNIALVASVSDSFINNVRLQSWGPNMRVSSGASNVLTGIYCGGTSDGDATVKGQAELTLLVDSMLDIRSDNAGDTNNTAPAFYMDRCSGNNGSLRATSPHVDNINGLEAVDSLYNTFQVYIGEKQDFPTGHDFLNGILESGTSNYNDYTGVLKDCGTNKTLGANSAFRGVDI